VNGVQWREVPSLYNEDARSQSYTVRVADDGTTSVIFGDGEHGVRLPTGTENVSATYRCGIGSEGEVDAGSLTLLKARPLGIREVTNPEHATGAANRDTSDQARMSGPLKVQMLGRIVSLRDLESFARTFPGIGKAQAVSLWNGKTYVVHLTIAAKDGQVVESESELIKSLVSAIRASGFLRQQIEVDSYEALLFQLDAKVRVDQRYQAEAVKEAIRIKLLEAFSFAKRSFAQSVFASEVIAVIQAVPGVAAVALKTLYGGKDKQESSEKLDAHEAKFDGERIEPAQLLVLNPGQEFGIDPNERNCIRLKVQRNRTNE
jgi:predicted phage baseplate assembly protein